MLYPTTIFKMMANNKIRLKLAQEMPFFTCTDYQVFRECSTQIGNIFEIFNDNTFTKQKKSTLILKSTPQVHILKRNIKIES